MPKSWLGANPISGGSLPLKVQPWLPVSPSGGGLTRTQDTLNQGLPMEKHRRGRDALAIVRKYFPKVKDVSDSKIGLTVAVSAKDGKYSVPGDPSKCALARACRRTRTVDGAIIGLSYSYIVHGTKAMRFKTSEGVSREIVSFDRHSDFAAGSYRLSPISKSNRLGVARGESTHPRNNVSLPRPTIHRTVRVRAV